MASTSLDQGEEISESMQQPMVRGDQRLVMYGGLTKKAKRERGCTAKERISKMPPCTAGKRSSIYRGVTRHRWTGRYEAHLWDKSTWNQNQNKKGKQVYLGAYDDEEAAARAYDLAALKYWGPGTLINFPVTDYTRDLEEMQNVSREEYLASLRRKSSGFARGMSKYRPLSRWESQFGHSTGTLNGDETSSGNEYAGHYSTERKIDLSNYLKWWGHHKSNQSDLRARLLDESKLFSSDDVAAELRALESSIKPTEPYEMPRLGTSVKQGKEKRISAMSILQKSSAYKSLQERTAKKKDKEEDSNDDANKDKVDRLGMPLPIDDKSCESDRLHRPAEAAFGMSEGLSAIQANVFPMVPLLSSPLHTSYSSIDPLSEPPLLWNPLAHVYPGGSSSRSNEVMKVEASSDYAFFQPGDEH